jgi:hypothetical protein
MLLHIGATVDISDVSTVRITSADVYYRYNNIIIIFYFIIFSDVLDSMNAGLEVDLLTGQGIFHI